MKYLYLVLLIVICGCFLKAQSVNEFIAGYSGTATLNGSQFTIQSSGYLKMTGNLTYPYNFPYDPNYNPNQPRARKDYEYFIWVVPTHVKEIVIESNTMVNAAFHYTHDLIIRGQNRSTSIIYGTQIKGWNDCAIVKIANYHPEDYWISAIHKTGGSEHSEIRNLTLLNPKAYFVLGLNSTGRLDVYDVNFVDNRGGSISNSDGIDVGPNSTIQNCFFECGDDNIKINSINMTVRDCTFDMVENSAPFQLGYGSYTNGNYMNAYNIKIIGTEGRFCDGNPIVSGGSWSLGGNGGSNGTSHVTVNIDGLYVLNPNASLINLEDTRQSVSGSIGNANLGNIIYSGQNHPNNCAYVSENNFITLCGQSPGTLYSCSGTAYQGSSVSDYTIPDFALDYICQNEGNHAYALLPWIIGTPAGNGILDNSCDCFPGGPTYSQYCGSNCESCGYQVDPCGGNIGNDYIPIGGNGCPVDINITTTYSSGTTVNDESSNSISASNLIEDGAVVDYDAGYEITLTDGFHAESGCDFEAFIAGCTNFSGTAGNGRDLYPTPQDYHVVKKKFTTLSAASEVKLHNTPNPFTGSTIIEYSVPETQKVSLTISDLSGQVIYQSKQDESQEKGIYQIQFEARNLNAGVYVCRLQTGTTVQIQKMTLLK